VDPPQTGCEARVTSAIERRLDEVRRGIRRVDVDAAVRLRDAGALFVDTRPEWQRREFGTIPGAILVERNHLEWRIDPTSAHRHPAAERHHGPIVVFCQEGYSSSLAVASLADLGVPDVHDLEGGYEAWAAAGAPVSRGATGRSARTAAAAPPGPQDSLKPS
jgi:rhodanese-related sulfurtransferase